MNKMRCVIVDDEPLAVELMAGYVRKTPSLELVGTYTDPVAALSEIRSTLPDLVFMDIQMPDLNGLELSRMLPEQTMVVFTTAFREYAERRNRKRNRRFIASNLMSINCSISRVRRIWI